jgi:hypothetical protein
MSADEPSTVLYRPANAEAETASRALSGESQETATAGPAAGGAPPDEALPIIPRFRVVRRIDGGGMGDVYEVVHLDLNRTFALKMIRPDRAGPGVLARFREEAQALLELKHDHIPRFHDYGEVDGRPYITMEYVAGPTLAERLPEFRDDPRRAVALLATIAETVQYVHDRGFLHRDLKPSNVLFKEGSDGPLVADFGLVKRHGAGEPETTPEGSTDPGGPAPPARTQTGAVMGTYGYMSPEAMRGQPGSSAGDVWALGIIGYQLLTGARPFADVPHEELLGRFVSGRLPPPSVARPGLDRRLDRFVMRCLAPTPEDRYPSAGALAADLRRWLAPRRTRRWLLAAAALMALGAGAAVAFWPARNLDPLPVPLPSREELLDRVRADLAAGQSVTLIGEDGAALVPPEVIVGADSTRVERSPEGRYRVHATGTALVELLDDPGINGFVLHCEVHAEKMTTLPELAGLFVNHRQIADPAGDWHFQVEYVFRESADNVLPPPAGDIQNPPQLPAIVAAGKVAGKDPEKPGLRQAIYHGSRFAKRGDSTIALESKSFRADKLAIGGPWRTLEIEARKERIFFHWEGAADYDVRLPLGKSKMNQAQLFLPVRPQLPLEVSPRGGIGLIVQGGSASFRNVVIRSLGPR